MLPALLLAALAGSAAEAVPCPGTGAKLKVTIHNPTTTTGQQLSINGSVGDPISLFAQVKGGEEVTVAELLGATAIALDLAPLSACPAAACGPTLDVTIDCLIRAVGAALSGCP